MSEHLAAAVLVPIAAALAALVASQPRSAEPLVEEVESHWGQVIAEEPREEWFNPRWGVPLTEQRLLHERWLIGDHWYSTRDLMGRRI